MRAKAAAAVRAKADAVALVVAIAFCLVAGAMNVAHAQETGGHMGGGDWGGGGGGGGGTSYSGGGGGGGFSSSSSPSWSSNDGWSHSAIPTYKPPDIPAYKPPTYTRDGSTGTTNTGSGGYEMSPEERARITREMQDFQRDMDRDRSTFNIVWWIAVLFIGGMFVKIMLGNAKEFFASSSPVTYKGSAPAMDTSEIDVTVLRVAIDGRARKFIQRELKQIAQTCDTATRDGRAAMLAQVSTMLRKVRDAWVYGGARNEPMGPLRDMKATYDRHVDDARTRFTVETIANVQGRTTSQDAGPLSWTSAEGEGVILVTIVIAARTELFTVHQIADGEDLRKALEGAAYLGANLLVAVDVIWTPSEENDRMSSLELEARYPAPMLIPIRGALAGKTFCTYCSGPFPAELQSCPHCGAPARSAA